MSEARSAFLTTLRAGLRGAPIQSIEEIIADYVGYFDDGAAANRSDDEIIVALGNPLLLADELRVELRIESWESGRTPRSALRVISGVIALGVLNGVAIFIATPVLLLLALALIAQTVALLVFGVWFLFAGAGVGLQGGIATVLLISVGSVAAAVSFAALTALGAIAFVNGLSHYARLHFRLLPRKTSIETKS